MTPHDERDHHPHYVRLHNEADANVRAALKLIRTASRQYQGLQEICLEHDNPEMATVHAAFSAVTEVAMYGLREFNDDWKINDDLEDEGQDEDES